jgi:DNA-binding sugar fermentation-stimulating protein
VAITEKIVFVHQSPYNPGRWQLILACGCHIWVSSKRQPKRKTAKCPVSLELEEGDKHK